MMNEKNILKYSNLTHPLIKDRIVMDYPLDVLLNRGCLLQDYENGIVDLLKEYNVAKNRLWSKIQSVNAAEREIACKELLIGINIFNLVPLSFTDGDAIISEKLEGLQHKLHSLEIKKTLIDLGYSDGVTNAGLQNISGTEIKPINVAIADYSHELKCCVLESIDEIVGILLNRIKICVTCVPQPECSCSIYPANDKRNLYNVIRKYLLRHLTSLKNMASVAEIQLSYSVLKTAEKNQREIESISKDNLILIMVVDTICNKIPDIFSGGCSRIDDKIKAFINIYILSMSSPRGKIGSLRFASTKDEDFNNDSKKNSGHNGSGNILIKGRPGSGKSTLALQMAVACTYGPNNYSSLYISLEEPIKNTLLKAREFSWDNNLKEIIYLDNIDGTASEKEIGESLKRMMTQPNDCPKIENNLKESTHNHHQNSLLEPKVFLPSLSPRSISEEDRSHDELFWDRLRQLERLLTGIEYIRENNDGNIPDIRMVCIDSLNVFGEKPLSRSELFKLFDLFKTKGVIGVFTAEQDSELIESPLGDVTEDYLADTIIQLHMEKDKGYAGRFIEIRKSRYQHQVYGMHPLRLRGLETENQFRHQWKKMDEVAKDIKDVFKNNKGKQLDEYRDTIGEIIKNLSGESETKVPQEIWEKYIFNIEALHSKKELYRKPGDDTSITKEECLRALKSRHQFFQPITVQPSLHYVVSATEMQTLSQHASVGKNFTIGNEGLAKYIKKNMQPGSIVTLHGSRSTYKTNIARNFLLDGIEANENVLLVTFTERSSIKLLTGGKINWKLLEDHNEKGIASQRGGFEFKELRAISLNDPKRIMKTYELQKKGRESGPRIIELTLKGGALIPEEFMEFIRDILREYRNNRIARVVLDDVAMVGQSYPLLKQSKTSGNLFLPAFTHVMKNFNVNTLIVGTTGQTAESDTMVSRACELADSELITDFCDVFGDRYVIVTGDGMHSMSSGSGGQDFVPAVLRFREGKEFEVDTELLQGLVGFGTPHIYRPGLRLYTFKEGPILEEYNWELQAMLSSSLGISWQEPFDEEHKPAANRTGMIAHSPHNKQDISVVTFDSRMTSAVHDSLGIIKNKPIDSTVVYSVDEFWLGDSDNIKNVFCLLDKKIRNVHDYSDNETIEQIDQIVPYYNNVLLIAYNENMFERIKPSKGKNGGFFEDWKLVIENVKKLDEEFTKDDREVYRNINERKRTASDTRAFHACCIDTSAKETIACILLDALWKKCIENGKLPEKPKNLKSENYTAELEKYTEVKQILINVQSVLAGSYKPHIASSEKTISTEEEKKCINTLPENAAIYICWYSQLRELLHAHPSLAGKLKVSALPNKGVKGDWYLGIAKGSVSIDLGVQVLNILNSKHEQYKRFSHGVGLPTLKELVKEEFPATNVLPNAYDLNILNKIHRKAFSRAEIKNYKQIRLVLYTIGEILTSKDDYIIGNDDRFYENVIKLFNHRCKILYTPEKNRC